jgi:radical SAM protein with 4Fe4S-binding SPASM domain
VPFKPTISDDILYAEKVGKHLFLNPNIPDWIVINSNAAMLLSKCDGKTEPRGIAESCGVSISSVEGLLRQATEHGIVENCSDPNDKSSKEHKFGESESRQQIAAKQTQLRIVHWKLTNSCDLRCRYCYAESGKDSGHMTIEELSRIAHEVSEISPSVEYVLSGGEPLLHPDAIEFAELLKSLGNRISLLTNGLQINANNAERIATFADRIKISLDGSTEEIHAITRGKGSYDAIICAIELLAELGANVQVAMTVHRRNRDDIEAMTRRFGDKLTFQPLFQAGRGAEKDDLVLTGNEYYEALAATDNVAPMAAIGTVLETLRGRGVTRCALAEAEISISETGDVYPCQLLSTPEFAAGNVRTDPLADIYFNSAILVNARSISINTLEKCRVCPIRLLCAGACRARDFYEVGSIEEVGDFCEYEQQAFINGLFDSVAL